MLLLWGLLALGLYNLGASHVQYEATVRDFTQRGVHLDGPTAWRALRMYLTDDGDVRRYYAYAEALLGRPYYSYFVRSAAQWQAEFAAPSAVSPDSWPLETPAAPLRPYKDYLIEYPPGLLLFTVPPALLLPRGDFGEAYRLLFCSEMALLLALAAWLARRLPDADAGVSSAGRFYGLCALGTLLLGPITTHRYDAVVSVLLCGTAWAFLHGRGRWRLGGAALALAVASKGVPLLTAPIWAVYLLRQPGGRRACASAVGAALLVGCLLAVPTLYCCGLAPLQALQYHAARPLQIESTGGALLGLLAPRGAAEVVLTYGSWNVVPVGKALATLDAALQRLSSALLGLGLCAAYAATLWRLQGAARLGDAVARRHALGTWALRGQVAALVVYMVLGRVFSPQYVVWLLPLGLVVARGIRGQLALLLVAMGLTQVIHPASYAALKDLQPWACGLVLLRNLALLTYAARLLLAEVAATNLLAGPRRA